MSMKKIIVLLVFWIFTLSTAWATQFTTQPATLPTYQFQSTSNCHSTVGNSSFTTTTVYAPYSASPIGGPRRTTVDPGSSYDEGDEWGDLNDDDYPTGVLPDIPIGEPFVLLLMAVAYFLVATLRKRQKEYHHLLNKKIH